jgi:hypothetical protein
VAAAQAAESRQALRAACLFAVLVSAKAITLVGRDVPLSAWSPFAYLWQDVCLVLLFFVVDRALRRPAPAWFLYALLAAYAAVNVPVTLVLSTPLTRSMLRGARGALADAVFHYLTAVNIVALAVPVAVAIALPLMFRRRPPTVVVMQYPILPNERVGCMTTMIIGCIFILSIIWLASAT